MLCSPLHTLLVGFVRRTWLVTLATVAVCSVFTARTVEALTEAEPVLPRGGAPLTPPPRVAAPPRTVPDGAGFVARNIFCSSCGPAPEAGPTDSPLPALEALLISTTIAPDAIATVRVPATEVQGSWSMGERIPGVGAITRIGSASIDLVDGAGRVRTLSLRMSAAGRARDGAATPTSAPAAGPFADRVKQLDDHTYDVDRALVRELVTGATKPGGVRVLPIVKGGEVQGVRLMGVTAATAPAAIGLRNGDVLDAIDGEPIKTAEQMLDLYVKLDQLSRVTLQGKRSGKPLTVNLNLR